MQQYADIYLRAKLLYMFRVSIAQSLFGHVWRSLLSR